MGSADVDSGGHPTSHWVGVNLAAWQHYHARRRGIERDFLGIWSDADAMLDPMLARIIAGEYAKLRAEMRMLASIAGGTYPVPVYD